MNRTARERNAQKVEATRARRAREDAAPRLLEKVASLQSLRLEVHETYDNAEVPGSRRARPIVVANAPAWFELPCVNPACTDGGHDVTRSVMKSLLDGDKQFEGSHVCDGYVDQEPCRRELHYVATATYADT